MRRTNSAKDFREIPVLPRSAWRTHANYPKQVLLLGSHDNFRELSAHLVKESMLAWSACPTQAPRANLAGLFRRWKRAMKSHEGYEEGKLYPYLEAKYGVSTAILALHHRSLGVAEDRVLAAERDGDALKFAHALKKHHEILIPHLLQEEELVIPLLLTLKPREFEQYSSGHISDLLRVLAREAKELENHG